MSDLSHVGDIMADLHRIADERDQALDDNEELKRRLAWAVGEANSAADRADKCQQQALSDAWFGGFATGVIITTIMAALVFWFTH